MNDLIYLIYSIGEEEEICFILGIDYFLSDQMKVTIVTAFKCRLVIADTTSLVHKEIIVVAEVTIVFYFFAGVPTSF